MQWNLRNGTAKKIDFSVCREVSLNTTTSSMDLRNFESSGLFPLKTGFPHTQAPFKMCLTLTIRTV